MTLKALLICSLLALTQASPLLNQILGREDRLDAVDYLSAFAFHPPSLYINRSDSDTDTSAAWKETWRIQLELHATYKSKLKSSVLLPLSKTSIVCNPTDEDSRIHFKFVRDLFRREGSERNSVSIRLDDDKNSQIDMTAKTNDEGMIKEQASFSGKLDSKIGFVNFTGPANSNGTLQVIGPHGWSIISDVDDTIKITNVVFGKEETFRSSACRHWKVTPNMPEFYRNLSKSLSTPSSPAAYHYVSNSIIQLAPVMQGFTNEHYIHGSLHLRNVDSDGDKVNAEDNNNSHKISTVKRLLSTFPKRKFILVGDSGERDPAVYSTVYRSLVSPTGESNIACILIRLVPKTNAADVIAQKIDELNAEARFAKDMNGVPQEKWNVFSDPKELEGIDFANGKCRL